MPCHLYLIYIIFLHTEVLHVNAENIMLFYGSYFGFCCCFVFWEGIWDLTMLLLLALNSWHHEILLQSPEYVGMLACAITVGWTNRFYFHCCCCWFFKTESHYVTLVVLHSHSVNQAGFELTEIHLPMPSKCWD